MVTNDHDVALDEVCAMLCGPEASVVEVKDSHA